MHDSIPQQYPFKVHSQQEAMHRLSCIRCRLHMARVHENAVFGFIALAFSILCIHIKKATRVVYGNVHSGFSDGERGISLCVVLLSPIQILLYIYS